MKSVDPLHFRGKTAEAREHFCLRKSTQLRGREKGNGLVKLLFSQRVSNQYILNLPLPPPPPPQPFLVFPSGSSTEKHAGRHRSPDVGGTRVNSAKSSMKIRFCILHRLGCWLLFKKKKKKKKSRILFGHFYLWEKFSRMTSVLFPTNMASP